MMQAWGNRQESKELFYYIDDILMESESKIKNTQNPLWAIMAELTPFPLDVLFKTSSGLREMADSVNRNLTMLFQDSWWKQTNVVASDFFLGNNLIEVAIQTNLKKSSIAQ